MNELYNPARTRLYAMKKLFLFSLTCLLCPIFGAAPVVSNITASQKVVDGNKTKIVDIKYDLQLDTGQKAFVEIWFSPDGGLNYPVRCQDVTGRCGFKCISRHTEDSGLECRIRLE